MILKRSLLLFITHVLLISPALKAGEYLVKYKPRSYSQVFSTFGFELRDTHHEGNYVKINIPDKTEKEVIQSLYQTGAVEYVVPNFKIHTFDTTIRSSDLKEQWHIAKVNAEQAWKKAGNKGSKKITVAVLDTGVDYNHESLKDNVVSGFNFQTNNTDPMDQTSIYNSGHGTHCSGIIGAVGIVNGGTTGLSPEVSILPVRIFNENGYGDLDTAIKGIDYAISKKVDIISASWGAHATKEYAELLVQAMKRAEDSGIIFIAAASNDGQNNDNFDIYPANAGLPNMISVSASDSNDKKPYWSNYGKAKVHLASPGVEILSTVPNNQYQIMSGTSMATPLVAGLTAFLKAQDSSLTGAQIRAILQISGDETDIETQCNCRVNALKATEIVIDKKMYIVPAAGTFTPNQKIQFTAYNAKGDVGWATTDENVLKFGNGGEATAVAPGEVTVFAKDEKENIVGTLKILVKQGPQK